MNIFKLLTHFPQYLIEEYQVAKIIGHKKHNWEKK